MIHPAGGQPIGRPGSGHPQGEIGVFLVPINQAGTNLFFSNQTKWSGSNFFYQTFHELYQTIYILVNVITFVITAKW
jgi:hypothetical protein